MTRGKWAKRIVLAVVLADCVGIYYANRQLNQPWQDPAGGLAVEVAATHGELPGERPGEQFAAKNALASIAPAKTNSLYPLPAYMPMPAAVKNELPVYVEPAGEFVDRSDFDRPRTARFQPPKAASRRFVSAFAADLAQAPAAETALPVPSFGHRAETAANMDSSAELAAERAPFDAAEPGAQPQSPVAPAESDPTALLPDAQAPAAPVTELPPASEAPAAEIAPEG